MLLTPSQTQCLDHLNHLLHFPILGIRGSKGSGRNTLITSFLQTRKWISFDLCFLTSQLNHVFTSQDIIEYLRYLSAPDSSLEEKYGPRVIRNPELGPELWIYLRDIDTVADICAEYGNCNRSLHHLCFIRWFEQLPQGIRIIFSTSRNLFSDAFAWTLKYEPSEEDVRFLFEQKGIDNETITKLLKISRNSNPGVILPALTYAKDMSPNNLVSGYEEAIATAIGSSLDPEREVPKAIPSSHLLGMESALEEIRRAIINPIRLNHPEIPVKKGLILVGPPGTGKTSVGRWLAHELKGKLYLIDGTVGVNGRDFIDSLSITLQLACDNAPAVIFIDDADGIFLHEDSLRALLTKLDGIDSKKRGNVCFIVTCNNRYEIPQALLRGGRLEMVIETNLPGKESRLSILSGSLSRLISLGNLRYNQRLPLTLSPPELDRLVEMTAKWNCADLIRIIEDVIRYLVDPKSSEFTSLFDIFYQATQEIIKQKEITVKGCEGVYYV